MSASTAWALSIGPGEASRIYKTTDAGTHWSEQFVNRDPQAFLDAMAFWNASSGVAVSDSVDGRFVILITRDGGSTWTRVPPESLPPALPNEGAFAASGTNVTVVPPGDVWIGTGAAQELPRPALDRRREDVDDRRHAAGYECLGGHLLDRFPRPTARHRCRRRLSEGVGDRETTPPSRRTAA